MKRVFVSYSHDSPLHKSRVLGLAQRLRSDGVDCSIDRFVNGQPERGWMLWMERELEAADFVLLVCTETYNLRFRQEAPENTGLGVIWESILTREQLYAAAGKNLKFVPVLFEEASPLNIPDVLRHRCTYYKLMQQYEELLRYLTDQPLVIPEPVRDAVTSLPPSPSNESDLFARSIRDHMAAVNRTVEQLTKEQFRIIQLLRGHRQVRVVGMAGSGKTLVAAEKGIRLSSAGLNSLFLCHNPLLAAHVSALTTGTGLRVESFSDWISTLAGEETNCRSGEWANYDEPSGGTLNAAFDNVVDHGPYYDAVIVDEAQDFRDEWWPVVQASLTDGTNGLLYVFSDDRQALLPYRATYPFAEPTFELSRNCRNAGRVYSIMRCIHPGAPPPEEALSNLGNVRLRSYDSENESEAIRQATNILYEDCGKGTNFVTLLGGGISFEASSFAGTVVPIGNGEGWREAVRNKLLGAMLKYDRRGVMWPVEGDRWAFHRLAELSYEGQPNDADKKLVREVMRKFQIHPDVRRRILTSTRFREALAWGRHEGGLRLWRPWGKEAPLWSAEVILFFEREDWADKIPPGEKLQFRPHYHTGTGDETSIIPVYRIDEFKGLEAEAVLLFFPSGLPIANHELYVGASRARSVLSMLFDRRIEHTLPVALGRFWSEQQQTDGAWKSRSAPEPAN